MILVHKEPRVLAARAARLRSSADVGMAIPEAEREAEDPDQRRTLGSRRTE